MEKEEKEIVERMEAATTLLERTLNWLEERQGLLTGEVERISATVEHGRREAELAEKLAAAERELESAAQDGAGGDFRDAGQARNRRRSGGRADPGYGAVRTEPGTAHCGEDPTAAGRRDGVKAVVSCQ
jgi:hypothetical protein